MPGIQDKREFDSAVLKQGHPTVPADPAVLENRAVPDSLVRKETPVSLEIQEATKVKAVPS